MKRTILATLFILIIISLSGCTTTEDTGVELLNFGGYTEDMIIEWFEAESFEDYQFIYTDTDDETLNQLFAGYNGRYGTGSTVDDGDLVTVIIYQYNLQESDIYFHVQDVAYDGPLLSESFASIDYLDPRGGYFEVTLENCTDGDTAQFYYPDDVYEAITAGAKSTRFLNMDTEETYSGGEEEWGKPASLYTCSLLNEATSIRLQTDPGDALLGNYGRLLAWVWVLLPGEEDYQLLNYMVVQQGLAQVKYEYGAGTTISSGEHTYNEWMHIAQDYAEENDLGQWSDLLDYYWDYTTDNPYYDRWRDAN